MMERFLRDRKRMSKIDSRNSFSLETMTGVVRTVQDAGADGFSTSDFDGDDISLLTTGFLVAKGILKVVAGGGDAPYVVIVNPYVIRQAEDVAERVIKDMIREGDAEV